MWGCLGKLVARLDSRTLTLSQLGLDLPSPPPARDWTDKLPDDVGMLANDRVGDCTCASAAHLIQVWTSQAKSVAINPSEAQVLTAYELFGYDPARPETDKGADMLSVLNKWRQGLLYQDHAIGAFVKLEHRDPDIVKAAIDYFGGVYVGAQMPTSAQTPYAWTDTTGSPGSWGGHCMAGAKYDRGEITFLTWGARKAASWDWWTRYVDEAYAIISQDWLEIDGLAPTGFDVEKLEHYLEEIAA